MILTVTMNPSIDTRYKLESLIIDDVNRAIAQRTPGGKGLNVARVLSQLGDTVLATGLLGGYFGSYLAQCLDEEGIAHQFSEISGETRTCLSILHENKQTEILERGPEVTEAELQKFFLHFDLLAEQADVITISGSLPQGVPNSTYAELLRRSACVGCKQVLVDSSGLALEEILNAEIHPYLVKINLSEASALLRTQLEPTETKEIIKVLRTNEKLHDVPWVVVSLGSYGCVATHNDMAYCAVPPVVEAVNATGSGDAMLAGFADGLAHSKDDVSILRTSVACGTLNAMDLKTGHIQIEKLKNMKRAIQVSCL